MRWDRRHIPDREDLGDSSVQAASTVLAAASANSSRKDGTVSGRKLEPKQSVREQPTNVRKKVEKKKRTVSVHPARKKHVRIRHDRTPSPAPGPIGPPGTSLSVLVVGDSLAVGVGMTLDRALQSQGKAVVRQMGRTSSGLESLGFYNWNGALREALDRERFDLVVVVMGANDSHNASGSLAWGKLYESRFSEFLKIPAEKRIRTVVVGLPPMKAPDFCRRVQVANDAIRNASHLFPETCVYIDSFNHFLDEGGNFTDYITVNGEWKKVRARDGVHFTGTGYLELSKMVARNAVYGK